MTPEAATKVRRHLEHSGLYFDNGLEALRNEEVSKAGEMLWGSMTQAFRGLAAARGVDVDTQRELKNFANRVSSEVGTGHNLWANFLAVEVLHRGFYDIDVELSDVQDAVPIARQAIESVSYLIPSEQPD